MFVVFIPKAGKQSHIGPKDYRSILLSSFVLEDLESLIDLRLRSNMDRSLLSRSQHTYSKSDPVESALHDAIVFVETNHLALRHSFMRLYYNESLYMCT